MPSPDDPNFLSKVVRCGGKLNSPDGTYFAYFPSGELSLTSQIAAYHKKLDLAGEGSRCNARQKKCGWAVLWRTAQFLVRRG